VVIDRHDVDAVLTKSLAREAKEAEFRQQIRNGATTVDLLGLADTLQRLKLS
jgi:4-hydroxy-4-methyl-2-oxoglutarate aldolase